MLDTIIRATLVVWGSGLLLGVTGFLVYVAVFRAPPSDPDWFDWTLYWVARAVTGLLLLVVVGAILGGVGLLVVRAGLGLT